MGTTRSRIGATVPALFLVAATVSSLGTIPQAPAAAAPPVVSVDLQAGPPPAPQGPPGPPFVAGPGIPPFVLQILGAVLPPPVLRLLESLGVVQPASP